MRNIASRCLVIHHENKVYDKALEDASWGLNAAGMRLYNEAIIMADSRQDLCSLEDNVITEKYNWKKNYTGKYTTNGNVCNCSWLASKFICLFFSLECRLNNRYLKKKVSPKSEIQYQYN